MNTQTFHAIDYNGGQIFVDTEQKGCVGLNYNYTLQKTQVLHRNYETHSSEWNFCKKIIAQSPNLSLPNIPYIEIEEYNDCYQIVRGVIKPLQPKVVSVVVEEEYQNQDGKWSLYYPFASSAEDIRPVTYTKDGKTFLKVKKVNYENN